MARAERIRERLPALYRPEQHGDDFLSLLVQSVGSLLDEADSGTADVLQSHWLKSSGGSDLERLASLLSVPNWGEPAEAYRARIDHFVGLYQSGLCTLDAIRNVIEAHLPADRPFWIQEFAPCVTKSTTALTPYEPNDVVGPLMDWRVTNEGVKPVSPTVYIQGVQPQDGLADPTHNPVIELYRSSDKMHRVGIAYKGTIAPGKTLRLMPAYASWIQTNEGVKRAESLPSETSSASPVLCGPWEDVPGFPDGTVVAFHYASDLSLWAAVNNDRSGALWRYDGVSWTSILDRLPALNCLAEDEQHLLVGKSDGLLRVPMYSEQKKGKKRKAVSVSALEGSHVNALLKTNDGSIWAGTNSSVALLTPAAQPDVIYDLSLSALEDAEVYSISVDRTGVMHFGANLGLFQYHPSSGKWHWYAGENAENGWHEIDPDAPLSDKQACLPPVRCVHRGPDASLWIGTDNGIARYVAKSVRDFKYETVFEAFPDITGGKVFAIRQDESEHVWFCTERGLFRYDGSRFWQYQGNDWVDLGRLDSHCEDGETHPRGRWRFDNESSRWQRWNDASSQWNDSSPESVGTDESLVGDIVWTDQVAADIGKWDGETFVSREQVPSSDLVARFKPDDTRIVNGGIPAIPRLPVGESVWRYLSMESEPTPDSNVLQGISIEGRLPSGEANLERDANSFDAAVFPFNPAAKVCFSWEPNQLLSARVTLKKLTDDERIDSKVIDEVWQAVQKARPAGVRVTLAVEDEIVRGK